MEKPELDLISVIATEAGRISELVRSCDLSAPVGHLGRWKIHDVVAHLGGVHRWANRIVTSRSMDGPGFTKSKLVDAELLDWFDGGVEEVLQTFRAADSATPCPNFNPGSEKTIGWWTRRQAHETTVHRWDIECALGLTTPISPEVAADGIDEFLDVFVRTRGKQTLIAPLKLATTQPPRSWLLSPAGKPGRVDVTPDGDADVAAELSGPSEELLLMLWGRPKSEQSELEVAGDPLVADSLVAGS